MSGDDYVKVFGEVRAITFKAVLLQTETGVEHWVPRSNLHGADDIALRTTEIGDTREFQIRRWYAEREEII